MLVVSSLAGAYVSVLLESHLTLRRVDEPHRATCLLVGWIVRRITQKLLNGFPRILDGEWVLAQNRSPINFWCGFGEIDGSRNF